MSLIEAFYPKKKQCHYCDNTADHDSPVCHRHEKCIQCNTLIRGEQVNLCIANGDEPYCAACTISNAMRLRYISNEMLSMPRKYFDYLNLMRLMFLPLERDQWEDKMYEKSSFKPTKTDSVNLKNFLHMHELTHEQLYLFIQRLEHAAAAGHILLHKKLDGSKNEIVFKPEKEKKSPKVGRSEDLKPKESKAKLTGTDRKLESMRESFKKLGLSPEAIEEKISALKEMMGV